MASGRDFIYQVSFSERIFQFNFTIMFLQSVFSTAYFHQPLIFLNLFTYRQNIHIKYFVTYFYFLYAALAKVAEVHV